MRNSGSTRLNQLFSDHHAGNDVYPLIWPFAVSSFLILIMYIVIFVSMSDLQRSLVNLKLLLRSQGQASRVVYYANELALSDVSGRLTCHGFCGWIYDRPSRIVPTLLALTLGLYFAAQQHHCPGHDSKSARLRVLLAQHSAYIRLSFMSTPRVNHRFLLQVYNTALYGGPTLNDSLSVGASDAEKGSLFFADSASLILFKSTGCLRTTTVDLFLYPSTKPACEDKISVLHEVATHALDPMIQRLVVESGLMAQDNVSAIGPASPR